ncbi:unnamed protein product [Brachionus calyciflorus]|uniref:Uncharacterized protein n=1 Tax=Brachionus calyciflorus TaxID=104777 RepID=A0A813P8B2_9BILA|nr:unnamed protein product [Brachionus calyciflorus]
MPRDSRRSYSRSPDRRSRSRSRSRSNDRYRSSRDYGRDDNDECRLHIADLTEKVVQSDLEKAFSKFGEVKEVWMAKNPPCFAFVVFKNRDDAAVALKEMDQRTIGPCRIRVTIARPRTRGTQPGYKKRWDPSMKCYQCGRSGHFARDCGGGGDRRRRSYSRDRYGGDRRRRYSRSRSRSPRRSRSYSRNRSRSRSPRDRRD